jgi:hypothetical protein
MFVVAMGMALLEIVDDTVSAFVTVSTMIVVDREMMPVGLYKTFVIVMNIIVVVVVLVMLTILGDYEIDARVAQRC